MPQTVVLPVVSSLTAGLLILAQMVLLWATVLVRRRVRQSLGEAGDPAAEGMLTEALRLWRGTALADVAHHGVPEGLTTGLEEMRLDALAALVKPLQLIIVS